MTKEIVWMINFNKVGFIMSFSSLVSVACWVWYLSSWYTTMSEQMTQYWYKIEKLETYKDNTNNTLQDIRSTLARLDERTLSIVDSLKKN